MSLHGIRATVHLLRVHLTWRAVVVGREWERKDTSECLYLYFCFAGCVVEDSQDDDETLQCAMLLDTASIIRRQLGHPSLKLQFTVLGTRTDTTNT
jgi:hypothetical protein